jgi:hypothetical protein
MGLLLVGGAMVLNSTLFCLGIASGPGGGGADGGGGGAGLLGAAERGW